MQQIIDVPDDQIIDVTAQALPAYQRGQPAASEADTMRDMAYYASAYLGLRWAGFSHEDATAQVVKAAPANAYTGSEALGDDDVIAAAGRFGDRYRQIGRYQRQTLLENVRDLTYWLKVFAIARHKGQKQETALRTMERGMNAEAGLADPFPPEPGLLPKRSGRVRGANHGLVDDDGAFLAVGITLFPAANRLKFDPDQLGANLAKLTGRVHYIRAFAVVGPSGGWDDRIMDPRWSDWDDLLQRTTDLVYDQYGIRMQWDIFGGIDTTKSAADRESVVRRFCAAMKGREDKIILVQMANEGYKNGFDPAAGGAAELLKLASIVRQELGVLVATTDAWDTPDGDPFYAGDVATVRTGHPDRSQNGSGGIWRPVRQTWDTPSRPALKWVDEPIGPKSSVAMDADPMRLAMMAAGAYMNGCAAFTFHTGAGVRLGGQADSQQSTPPRFYLPRERNVYEAENFDTILDAIGRMATKLPADAQNWQHLNGNQKFPAYPFNVDKLSEEKVLRAYCAMSDRQFVIPAMQVQQDVQFEARRPMTVRVFDPLTWDQVDQADLNTGQAITLRGGSNQGWILMGDLR